MTTPANQPTPREAVAMAEAGIADAIRLVSREVELDRHARCCLVREDYDGEKITTHCREHCARVQSGDWDRCRGC